jgi:hypothetical protein
VSGRLTELQPWLYPWAAALVALASQAHVQVSSVRRTWQQQAQLYAAFRRGESHYPALPPGRSLHQYGRAFDLIGPAAVLGQLGDVWRSWGGRWGPEDPIHFEA